jgi:hypothetical protein
MSERNLTKERQLAYLKRQKAQALAQIGKSETMVVATVKRDKKGNEVLDEDGVPVVVDKRVLKSKYIADEHDARIAHFDATGHLK